MITGTRYIAEMKKKQRVREERENTRGRGGVVEQQAEAGGAPIAAIEMQGGGLETGRDEREAYPRESGDHLLRL